MEIKPATPHLPLQAVYFEDARRWLIRDSDGFYIAQEMSRETADWFVHAANAYPGLVARVAELEEFLTEWPSVCYHGTHHDGCIGCAWRKHRAALLEKPHEEI